MRVPKGVEIPDIDLSPVNVQIATMGKKMDEILDQIKTPSAPPATNMVILSPFKFLKDENV